MSWPDPTPSVPPVAPPASDPVEMDPGYFDHPETTALVAINSAHAFLSGPLKFEPRCEAHDLQQRIADLDLVIHAREYDADGQEHLLGVDRPSGRHLLISGTGLDRHVAKEFTSGSAARQYFRAKVLREAPKPGPHRADLPEFASALAAQLGVWTATVHDLTLDEHHNELHQQVWDAGTLDSVFEEYWLHEAAVLTSPDGVRAVVVHDPQHRDQFLVGALRPTDVATNVLNAPGAPAPLNIAVHRDPARAADDVRQQLLPDHGQALFATKINALIAAAEGISRALADWDAVSDSLCDAEGWPLDKTAYDDGLVARDAAAWEHVETFLSHAPPVVKAARENLLASALRSDFSSVYLWYHLRETTHALAEAADLKDQCEWLESVLIDPPRGSRQPYVDHVREQRNSGGWHYATELADHTVGLTEAAMIGWTSREAGSMPQSARVAVALARSRAATVLPPSAYPPPDNPRVPTFPSRRRQL